MVHHPLLRVVEREPDSVQALLEILEVGRYLDTFSDQAEIAHDRRQSAEHQIMRGHQGEMAADLVLLDFARDLGAHLLHDLIAPLFFLLQGRTRSGEILGGLVEQTPQERIFEPIPQTRAGAQGIGQGVQREHAQGFERLHLIGEGADNRGIVEVATLGNLDHEQMMLD